MSKMLGLMFVVLFGAACAEVADFQTCGEYSADICEVKEVRITPCKGGKICKLKKGTESSIQFDYVPNFSADKLISTLFWASSNGDVPFSDFRDVDVCNYTGCPLQQGKEEAFAYSLRLSKKLPKGKYTLKWEVWNAANKNETCCFTANVDLVR